VLYPGKGEAQSAIRIGQDPNSNRKNRGKAEEERGGTEKMRKNCGGIVPEERGWGNGGTKQRNQKGRKKACKARIVDTQKDQSKKKKREKFLNRKPGTGGPLSSLGKRGEGKKK